MANLGSKLLEGDWLLCREGIGRRKAYEETSKERSVRDQAGDAGGFAGNGRGDEGKWQVCEDSASPGDKLDVGIEGKEGRRIYKLGEL